MSQEVAKREPLAIVGMGCRFPGGVSSVDEFWKLMVDERSGIVEVPADRWNKDRFYNKNSDIPGKMITKWAGFLDRFDEFDAQFFGISPREALRMDPQQRWLLEVAWETMEDAGVPPESLRESLTGVFIGIASNDYANVAMGDPKNVDVHTNSGSTLSIASNRIAYLFDLKGPAVSVDTACSSALVAVNLACHAIWSGQATLALAGGVNALLTPDASIGFSKASMLSPNGKCFAFDARANGYVRGEGAGIVMIKPLSKAIEDGNHIYSTIRAAVINQDGNTSSMTVPGVESQAEMLRVAFEDAGMEPRRVCYMEAHGTGTPVGDPIETRALGLVLSQGRGPDNYCLVGSVKTNIGHLESGSGIAGLIKASLVLEKDQVPPNLNFESPNPNIPFDDYRLKVVTELQPLPRVENFLPVTAVNSFGFGGTNAHIVLEGAPAETLAGPWPEHPRKAQRPFVLPISGRGEAAMRASAVAWRHFLHDATDPLAEIAAAAGARRDHHDNRLVIMGDDTDELRHNLTSWLGGSPNENVLAGRTGADLRPLVFVFTGQGAQWWAMGQQLLEREPVFRKALEDIDFYLKPLAGWSLIEEMSREEADSQINRTNIAQPAIFGLQVALSALWESWGIRPQKVVGHSVGEVAAAYIAGAYSLEDAVKVIFHRSRLQDSTGGLGRMAAIGISTGEAKKLLKGKEHQVQVAVINSPTMITLAGDTGPLEEVVNALEAEGRFVRWLRIDYAFHTHQMDPIQEELLEVLSDIQPKPTRIPYISTVTGGALEGEKLDAHYWWRNVREAVLFAPALTGMIRAGDDTFLEIGPHPALTNPITECLAEQKRKGHVFHSLMRKTDETTHLLSNLCQLHFHGCQIDWVALNQATGGAGRRIKLPGYQWQRERFWLESAEGAYLRTGAEEHPLLGLRQTAPKPTWRFELDPRLFPWLNDHRFWDSVVFPAAGYGEIGLAVARNLFPGDHFVIEDLEMKKALFVSEAKVPTVEVVFDPQTRVFQVFSSTGDRRDWELNSQGVLRKIPRPEVPAADFETLRKPLLEHFTHEQYYDDYAKAGYQFGPNFQHLQNVWRRKGESFAEVVVPEGILDSLSQFHFHPALLDACFHTVKGAQVYPDGTKATDHFYLPATIRSIRLHVAKPPARLWAHGRLVGDNPEYVMADIMVYDDDGALVAEILGFRADHVDQADGSDLEKCLYQNRWEVSRLKGTRLDGSARLASPSEIVAASDAVVFKHYEAHGLSDHYEKFMPRIDAAARQFIINAYLDLGWCPQLGERITVDKAMHAFDIAEQHRKLVYGHFVALTEGGWLRSESEDSWEVVKLPERGNALRDLDQLAKDLPKFASEVALSRATGPKLAGVLSGEVDPITILFPGGSSNLLETFYRDGADFPVINELIKEAIGKAVANLPERRALRILEIGAGTGSLTRRVLPALPADRTEYFFSDNGPMFLAAAKEKFGESYPFVEYTVFDVEKSPTDQGLPTHNFDIVLASNVIHATADLRKSLAVVQQCLAPDGLFLFLEVTWRRAPLDNVFGLLPGWWRFRDSDLRTHSALLSRRQWEELLQDSGFREVTSFISSPKSEEDQQACFIGKAPVMEVTPSENAPYGTILLIGSDAISAPYANALAKQGAQVVTVDGDLGTINDAFDHLNAQGSAPVAVVHALTLGTSEIDGMSQADLDASQAFGVRHVHALIKLVASRTWTSRPKFFFLTRSSLSVIPDDAVSGLAHSPIAGLLRVANNEIAEFQWTLIDLDGRNGAGDPLDVAGEVLLSDGELELAYRGPQRWVRRVHRIKSEELPVRTRDAASAPDALPYRLQVSKPGILTNLSLNETGRRAPDPGEIEVLVKAGGINFRDVMKALGMYPGNPQDLRWFGDDFSGVVVRVGQGVKDLKPGDEVVGMAPYCFRSHVTVHRSMVFRKPADMPFVAAATLPTVFLTTHYAINELGRMRKGESILIHAGTGGVGQAAIQIALDLGLTIFSTAGSPEKRKLLETMGVHHVLDSRSLVFADRIMEITDGRGVDAVLNSLAGDFIPKNLSVLSTFGRYMEIGKVDVYGNSKIGLEPLRNNISFFVIDLAQHLEHKPEYVAEMFSALESKFASKTYVPLPHTDFPITEVVEAFRYMAAGKHIGKNVLDFAVQPIPVGPSTEEGRLFHDRGTWLVTGGAGGFGLQLVKWMAANGARHFALMSRSGPKEDAALEIETLRSQGVTILDARGDATRREDVDRVVAEIQKSNAPLVGVIHGAMVLDDEFIVELDEERFSSVLRPKMLGAWNLHQATLGIPLEHFICFSSFSAFIGAVKQSNYNAGNVFLDQLAHHRRAQGLPALTFNWGAITGAGFVARNEKTQQYLEKVGLASTNLEETIALFRTGVTKDGGQLGAARVDWTALARFSPSVGSSKIFNHVVPRNGDGGGGDSAAARILEAPPDKRQGLVEELIAAQVAAVLGTESSRIDRETPLTNLGLDSLMAIELVNRIEEKLGFAMPMGSVLNGPNIRDLSVPVLEKLLENSGSVIDTGASSAGSSSMVPFLPTGEMPEVFPLSEGQRALWFLNRLAPDSSAYNLIFSGKFRPLLDIEAMKTAFAHLYQQHPMFDVVFETRDGEPVQVLRKGGTIDFREHDCSALDDSALKELISEHANRPFDLTRGPVVRLELFRTSDQAHVALLAMHHIISDAWSVVLLMQDLIEAYFAVKAGRQPRYEENAATYADFVSWEREHLNTAAADAMLAYWKDQMAGAPSGIDLPTDRPRPALQTFNGGTHGFQLDEILSESIQVFAREHQVTVFMALLSAYEILLHRYCNQDDLIVGVPLAGRTQQDLQKVVGYFINPVPLRADFTDDPTISAFLSMTRQRVNGALENQQYPLAKLVDKLRVPRDPGRSPLFQVSFSMERIPGVDEQGIAVFLIGQGGHTFHIGDLSMETVDLTTRQAQFEITLVVEEAGGNLYGCWQYNRDLFDAATIDRLSGLFEQVVRQMIASPESRVSEIALLDSAGADLVLNAWNQTNKLVSGDLLHEAFAKSAARHGDRTAVSCGDRELSYAEVDRLSNGVAEALIAAGVLPRGLVGVAMGRGVEMVAALLGVLKAGATYVPLDPEFPAQRLQLMLQDAAPAVILTSKELTDRLPSGSWITLAAEDIEPRVEAPTIAGITAEDLAYVIYTSGSTGTPKGVEIPHRAVMNFLGSMADRPGISTEDRLLAVTTLSFDISVLEVFLPLLHGAQVVVANRDEVKDGRRLARLLDAEEISVMQATPATWRLLLEAGWEGRSDLRILCGGEALPRELANTLVNSAKEVWNLYGPTETTVWSTVERITEGLECVSIGRPIDNTRVYVLDSHRQPLPSGFTGELYIGGDGLARGYRNRSDLTDAAFVEHNLPDGTSERIYRTGDLARWLPDGRLECLGRVDFQIKVRGVRIELGELESQIASHLSVRQAVVTKRTDLPAGEGLVAYLVTEPGAPSDLVGELRHYLADRLPAGMIPSYFVVLDELPLTPNRKVDRRRLPVPSFGKAGDATLVAPETPAEKMLWDIFRHSFETDAFGITDNFFEMGGDSLMALRIVVEVSSAFHREVPVEAFLRHPTIEQLARYLLTASESVSGSEEIPLDAVRVEDLEHIEIETVGTSAPPLDAVALTYIPEALASLAGVTRDEVAERWMGGRPILTNVYELPMGRIGVIMLPCFEVDFYKHLERIKQPVLEALELAAQAGARTVSLTGVIPSTTNHGREIERWIDGRTDLPVITTGDATRSATIVRSVEGILAKAGRGLERETLAFIGLGSIGRGTLELLLQTQSHPAKLILCDPYLNDAELGSVRDAVRKAGFKGDVSVAANGGGLPAEAYTASLVVASTNLPGILDIRSLNPGSLVVDYSFPPVFRVADAVQRLLEKEDILFTTGGELHTPGIVKETIYLPEAAETASEAAQTGLIRFLAGRDASEITGCVLVSLLTGQKPEVKATLGPLAVEDAAAHYAYLIELGIEPARLQMQGWFLPEDKVEAFGASPRVEA